MYDAPGLNSTELRQFLLDQYPTWTDDELIEGADGKSLYRSVTGNYAGTIAKDPEFLIVPASLEEGCFGAAKILKSGTPAQIDQLMNKIRDCKFQPTFLTL